MCLIYIKIALVGGHGGITFPKAASGVIIHILPWFIVYNGQFIESKVGNCNESVMKHHLRTSSLG